MCIYRLYIRKICHFAFQFFWRENETPIVANCQLSCNRACTASLAGFNLGFLDVGGSSRTVGDALKNLRCQPLT